MVKCEWAVAQHWLRPALRNSTPSAPQVFPSFRQRTQGKVWDPGHLEFGSAPEQAGNTLCLLQSTGHNRRPLTASAVSIVQSYTPF